MVFKKVKLLTLLILVLLLALFIIQNTAPIDVRFLFWQFSAGIAVVIFFVFALGFAFGLVVANWINSTGGSRKRSDKEPSAGGK